MNDSQILSSFGDLPMPGAPAPRAGLAQAVPLLAWDACQLGVVLRAVLG